MNEQEYKKHIESGGAICSVTGRPCKCDSGGCCRRNRSSLDSLPDEAIRRLKTCSLHIDIARQDTLDFEDTHALTRVYPKPEVREVRRLLDSAQRILEEVLGG